MSIPSNPSTKGLADCLTTVGKHVKTSKYKFYDWNIKTPISSQRLPEAEFKKLSRAAQFFREGHYTREDIKKIQDAAREAKTKVKEAEKLAKDSKNLWDKFLSKTKGASQAVKAANAAGTVAKAGDTLIKLAPIITALIAIVISVAVNQIQGWRNDINEDGQQKLSDSISKVLGLMNAQKQRIDRANEGVKKAELENQRVRDRVYSLEKQQPAIRESVADAKKKANDALYETRANKPKLEAQIAEAKKKANDALYETRAGRTKLETQIIEVKKQSNDALYETRAGQTKLGSQIAEAKKQSNDALYETRQNKVKIDSQISQQNLQINSQIKSQTESFNQQIIRINNQLSTFSKATSDKFQQSINVEISKIRNEIVTLKTSNTKPTSSTNPTNSTAELTSLRQQVQALGNIVNSYANKVSGLEISNGVALNSISNLGSNLSKTDQKADKALKEAQNKGVVDFSGIQKQLDDKFNSFVNENNRKLDIQGIKQSDLAKDFNKKFDDFKRLSNLSSDQRFKEFQADNDKKIGTLELKQSDLSKDFDKKIDDFKRLSDLSSDQRFKEFQADNNKKIGNLELKQSDLSKQFDRNAQDLRKINTDIGTLDTKIQQQEKVNQSAIPKLDQLLGLVPLIPARAAAAIRPDIPTIPQIETASATGTCRTLQPGGCSRKAFDDLGNGINQNTNNQSNNLFDKLNAGANAAQLVLLKIIDNKLGAQITGGISGKLVDGFKWLHLDRVLGILTFAATVQNHVMLSNSIGTTLLGAFGNVLSLIGLKDDQGQAYDVGSVINSSIESFVKSIVGAENYENISEAWAKANRIYQATTNVLNAFQGLSSTILSGMELIAGNNSKIGNALKKAGTVLDNAYGWMNPQPKFNRVTQILEKFQAGASTIQMVTQAPLDIINATTELQNANTELVKALKEDKPENKAPEIPEPDKLKADELVSKIGSRISNILPDDLFNAAD